MNGEDAEKGKNPMLAMTDELTGDCYACIVEHKGVNEGEEGSWIVADVVAELKARGYKGGDGGHLSMKSDGESSINALIEAIARRMGGN